MERREARARLGLPPTYTRADLDAAFRRAAKVTHPDRGGDPREFTALVESRRVLLATPRPAPSVVVIDGRTPMIRLLQRLQRLVVAKPRRVV